MVRLKFSTSVEVEKPSPKHNEVLIKVFANTVTAANIMMREGKPFIGGLYLGFDFAGKIVEVGKEVTLFKLLLL